MFQHSGAPNTLYGTRPYSLVNGLARLSDLNFFHSLCRDEQLDDIAVIAATNSSEIAIFGRTKNSWNVLSLSEGSQPSLPISKFNDEDSAPVGIAIDFSIALSENAVINTAISLNPVLLLLNTDGVLSIYHILSTQRTEKFSGLQKAQKLPIIPLESRSLLPLERTSEPVQTTKFESKIISPVSVNATLSHTPAEPLSVSESKPLSLPKAASNRSLTFEFGLLNTETKTPSVKDSMLQSPLLAADPSVKTKGHLFQEKTPISKDEVAKPIFSFQSGAAAGEMVKPNFTFGLSSTPTDKEKTTTSTFSHVSKTNGSFLFSSPLQQEKSSSTNLLPTSTSIQVSVKEPTTLFAFNPSQASTTFPDFAAKSTTKKSTNEVTPLFTSSQVTPSPISAINQPEKGVHIEMVGIYLQQQNK
jgi:hypothetical protein